MKVSTFAATVSLFALFATPAYAQSAPNDEKADNSGDIVVTANRSESLLSKTPIAMTAVTGEGLTSAGITNPTALAEQVPNLDISRSNGLQITIRGVTSTDGTEKGDPSAAFMLDGIYIARPQVQEVSFYDINRVEVLRGPQGTLYGRNTTAGVVNVLSNKPDTEAFSGSMDVSYGNFNAIQATGVVNIPAGENLAFRAAVNYDSRDSYLKEGTGFATDLGSYKKNLSGRFSALVKLGNGELVLRADYSDIKGTTFNAPSANPFFSGLTGTFTDPRYIGGSLSSSEARTVNMVATAPIGRKNKTWGVTADFSQDFGGIALNYLGSYREFERHEDNLSIQGGGTRTIPTRFDGEYWQQSHELRLSTTGDGPLKAQVGGYYFQEQSGIGFYLFGLLNPTVGQPGYVFGFPQDPTKAKSYAGFAQATYSVTPEFRVTAGVRYSKDDKSRVGNTVVCSNVACTGVGDSKTINNAERTFSKTTWRVGFDYDVNDATLLYGTVSTGYKAGGFNDGCIVGTGTGCARDESSLYYEPETLMAYEVGLKTRFADDAVRLNLSAFHYDYKQLQLSSIQPCSSGSNTLCQFTANAGTAKIDGIEAEVFLQPGPNDRFNFNVNYLNARYDEYTPALAFNNTTAAGIASIAALDARFSTLGYPVTKTVSGSTTVYTADWSGIKLDRSPTWTISAGYQHTFEMGNGGNVQVGINTRFSDSYKLAALANVFQFEQPSFTKTDANITYNAPDKRFYVQGFVKNIEDTIVVTTAGPGVNGTVQLGDPRTFGVRAGFKF